MLGAVEATAASAPEKADDVPSTPAEALGELDYNVMQFNALRDSRARRLPIGVERAATRCHRTAAPALQRPEPRLVEGATQLGPREPPKDAQPAANASEMICLASSWIRRRCSIPLKLSA